MVIYKFVGLLIVSLSLSAQEVVDYQILEEQKFQEDRDEKAGYGDIEIDLLHKRIKNALSQLMTSKHLQHPERYRKEVKGKHYYVMRIASGESIKSISERYLYVGTVYIETDKEGKTLTSIRMSFERLNPLGVLYKKQKRDLINPSPNFSDKNDSIDENKDITLVHYETIDTTKQRQAYNRNAPKKDEKEKDSMKLVSEDGITIQIHEEFNEKFRTTLEEVPFYNKKLKILETYKKYLRRTVKRVEKQVYYINLKHRVRLQELLEVK